MQFLDNYNYFGYLKGANEVNRQYFQQAVLLYYCTMLAKSTVLCWNMLVCCMYHYAQNYAGIIHQGLLEGFEVFK